MRKKGSRGWRHQRGRGRKNEINIQRSADGEAEMRCEKESKNRGRKEGRKIDRIETKTESGAD